MTLLQFILIVSSFVFILLSIDAYQRKKINFLHFIIFITWLIFILIFSYNHDLLNKFWSVFWIPRWADLLVYLSIIFLFYIYFELLNFIYKEKLSITKLNTNLAISNPIIKWSWKSEFLFFIPAYNEEKTIINVLDSIYEAWYDKVIVVNDWSKDKTLDLLVNYNPKWMLIILNHYINRWVWAWFKTLFEYLKRNDLWVKWIVSFDADWQMDVKDMEKFKKYIDNKCFLVWSRFLWSAKNMPFFRKIIIIWSRFVNYFFTWVFVSDPHNWYRVFPISFALNSNLFHDRMERASEFLEEAKRLWYKVVEVPVTIRYTEYSLKKWQKNLNALKILLQLFYKKFFYK